MMRGVDPASFLDQAYGRGHVLDEEGGERALMPHSIPREQGEALRELALREGAVRTVEVGLALGIGTLWLCSADVEHHVTIDPLQRHLFGAAGLRSIREAGAEPVVEFVEQESQTELTRMVREGRSFDLAYVDGDHRFESAFIDVYFCGRLVRPGRPVVVDDMHLPALRAVVSHFERNMGWALDSDALPDAFRRGRRGRGSGDMAVLRTPAEPVQRDWREFRDIRSR